MIFAAVFAYVNVVVVGTLATAYVPSYAAPTPVITTELPTTKPCATEVVSVTTLLVNAAFVTVNPRRMSVAPPPPVPLPDPAPPPLRPPVVGTLYEYG